MINLAGFYKRKMFMMNFKELRKAQHITLTDASKGICSVPMLSRWENGQGNMDLHKAIKLFERINITTSEYIALNKLDMPDNEAQELESAWHTQNEQELKIIAQKSLAKFHQDNKLFSLDYAALSCALYQRISKINIFPVADQNKLNKQLSKLTIWSQENLSLFQNVTNILSPSIIFQISSQVIANFDFINKAEKNTLHFAITTLFEAIISLLKASEFKYAQSILNKINLVILPENEMQLIMGRYFLNSLMTYLENQNDQEILQIITLLTKLNMKHMASYFLEIFNSLKANLIA